MSFKHKKSFGQHFLHNDFLIGKIADSVDSKLDFVLEIGPGEGAITGKIIENKMKTYLIEADQRLWDHLKQRFPSVTLYQEDALEFDWDHFFTQEKLDQASGQLVSNLPYNISTPLLLSFLPLTPFKKMTLMFQKEVADKCLIHEQIPLYRLASVIYPFFTVSKLCDLKPGAFTPPPKVQSSVLVFERRPSPLIPYEQLSSYESFVKALASMMRKKIKKAFKPEAFHGPMDPSIGDLRFQDIAPDQLIKLFQFNKFLKSSTNH
jgi:16S rRNA (adenine1518-N6/adenine1519-N6)-dimethyltransferase